MKNASSDALDDCGRTLGERGSAGRDGCGRSPWLGPSQAEMVVVDNRGYISPGCASARGLRCLR